MLKRPTALSLALLEAERIQSDKVWVKIDATVENIVRLEWGMIYTINEIEQRERAIASRRYEQREHAVEVGPVMAHS